MKQLRKLLPLMVLGLCILTCGIASADTVRTRAALDTIFADGQPAGSISATDVRDFLTSTYLGAETGWADHTDTEYPCTGTALSVTASTDTILPNNSGTTRDTYKPEGVTVLYSPASITYDALTSDFTAGQVVTGGSSGATATIQQVSKDGTVGTLFLGAITGTFTNNETITDPLGGSATIDGSNSNGKILGIEGESYVITVDAVVTPTSGSATYVEIWFDIGGAVGELYRRISSFPKGTSVARPITITTFVYTLDTWAVNGADVYISSNGPVDVCDIRFVIGRVSKVAQ